jgi:predicted AAA+ superfamily ATPase
MNSEYRATLRAKVVDGLAMAVPAFTRRDVHVPGVKGKALAVIGMRRSGKTTFMWQCLADRLRAGIPRESLLYFSFEDERLAGMTATGLQWVVEEYFALHPERRDQRLVTFFLDEIQVVAGWEAFVRRLIDTEKVELFVSGSSARLLSREVATSMRGRAMEVLVHPFSFREVLRHAQAEPDRPSGDLPKAARSAVEKHFRSYLVEGGFPEAQGLPLRDRAALLRTYVDVAILRDVIERHGVSNSAALRWLLRHLLGNPASAFSVEKFHLALKSQGLAVGKNTLHDYLAHLEDAFLVRTVALHTASERQRMVNPRKAYPVDPGLIPVYERAGRANLGRALETAVLLELERRGCEVGYVRTDEGYEVDFRARGPEGRVWLIQVAAEVRDASTWQREVRALARAAGAHPGATAIMLTADVQPPEEALPSPLKWQPAASWLLGEDAPE